MNPQNLFTGHRHNDIRADFVPGYNLALNGSDDAWIASSSSTEQISHTPVGKGCGHRLLGGMA